MPAGCTRAVLLGSSVSTPAAELAGRHKPALLQHCMPPSKQGATDQAARFRYPLLHAAQRQLSPAMPRGVGLPPLTPAHFLICPCAHAQLIP